MLEAIVESSNDAIISETLDGIITSWNRSAEHIFGYTADEMVGRPISVLAVPGHEEGFPVLLARIRRGERVQHFETLRRAKDGRIIQVSLSLSPIFDDKGVVVGAAKIARDVTQERLAAQNRAEAELERLVQRHHETDRRKDEFLAMLAHELRNSLLPLRLIGDIARLHRGAPLSEPHREVLERQVAVLSRLVNDLLDVTRVTDGKAPDGSPP